MRPDPKKRYLPIKLIVLYLKAFLVLGLTVNSINAQSFEIELYNHVDGLSENSVNDIFESSSGEIYLFTPSGIDMFDGFAFKNLEIHPDHSEFMRIVIDANDVLWAVPLTMAGKDDTTSCNIILFDLKTKTLISPKNYLNDPDNILYRLPINYVYKTTQGYIAMASGRDRYFCVDQNIVLGSSIEEKENAGEEINNRLTFFLKKNAQYFIEAGNITHTSYLEFSETEYTNFNFPVTHISHVKIPESDKNLKPIFNEKDSSLTFVNDYIIDYSVNIKDSVIYFAVKDSTNLYPVKIRDEEIEIDTIPLESFLENGSINRVYQNHEDELWIGTTIGLVNLKKSRLQYNHYIAGKSTRDIIQISSDSAFICSYYGVYILEKDSKKLSRFCPELPVYSAAPLEKNKMIFGHEGRSLDIWNKNDPDQIIDFNYAPEILHLSTDIHNIDEITFLLATNKGLKKVRYIEDSLVIENLMIDHSIHTFCDSYDPDEIFILHKSGFFGFNTKTNKKIEYEFLKNKTITFIYHDKFDQNILWIGTSINGLYRWDKNQNEYKNWDKNSGLTNSKIHSIYEDQKSRLWISTNFGLNCLNKETYEIVHFFNSEESPVTEFNRSSSCQLTDGSLLFGSINGFIHFDPNQYVNQSTSNQTKITKYSYVDTKTNTLYEKENPAENEIWLPRNHRDLKLYLESNLFQDRSVYKYSSSTGNWDFTSKGLIELGKLDIKDHTIYISKKMTSKEWTNPLPFVINVEPPFYLNRWFWIGSLLVFLISIVLWISKRNQKIIERNRQIKKEVREKTAQIIQKNEQLEHMNQTNEILFDILSHDFRTPITSMTKVSAIINNLLEEKDEKISKVGETIEMRSKKLLVMLENLMEWTQIQKRMGSFVFQEVHVESLISSIINELFEVTQEKNITISFEQASERNYLYTDIEALKVVLRNVLNNAIKFSSNRSEIEIVFNKQKHSISIKDFAGGIPPHIIDLLESNKKINSTANRYGEVGLGIGLQISKYLLKGIKGRLEFEVQNEIGTITHIILEKKAEE